MAFRVIYLARGRRDGSLVPRLLDNSLQNRTRKLSFRPYSKKIGKSNLETSLIDKIEFFNNTLNQMEIKERDEVPVPAFRVRLKLYNILYNPMRTEI